jgi:hypothetical protein
MSLTRNIYDECYEKECKAKKEGAFEYTIFHPKNESSERCNKDAELDFEKRVNVDSNLKNLGIPLGKCAKNRYTPDKGIDTKFTPPSSCSKYFSSAFENNIPKPSQVPFDPEKYYYKERTGNMSSTIDHSSKSASSASSVPITGYVTN